MDKGYTVEVNQQPPGFVEYVIKGRPEEPSVWRLAGEALLLISKFLLLALDLAILLQNKGRMTLYYAVFTLVSAVVWLRRPYTEESVLVLRDFGIQVSSSGRWYLGKRSRFIPKTSVLDVVIQEAFIGFEIKFIMVILVQGEEKLEVVFTDTLPRRADLENIWRGVRKCYYENP